MKILTPRTLRRIQIAAFSALALSAVLLVSSHAGAVDPLPATQPSTQPASQPAQSTEALTNDLNTQFGMIQDVLAGPDTLTDPVKRAAAAPRVLPGLKKLVGDLNGLMIADPDHKADAVEGRAEFTMLLSLFGDSDATKTLSDESVSTSPDTALEGKRSQLMIAWINSATDTKAQTSITDQIENLAKSNITDKSLTMQLFHMTKLGCSSPDLSKRLEALITDVMKNDASEVARQQIAAGKQQEQAEQKLASLENKPLTLAGKQPDGKAFSTEDWKGKVILVDFWATWCGPCREELPRVAKLYSDYHSKGLEILGVDNDYSAEDLNKFLGEHKELPWPQLMDAAAATAQQWNPITLGFGINGIPTMFLIDKKGICRTVSARQNMEEIIPKLLAE